MHTHRKRSCRRLLMCDAVFREVSVTFSPTFTVVGVPVENEVGIFQVSVVPDGVRIPGALHS